MKKKLIAILLVMTMAVCVLPVSAFAEDVNYVLESEAKSVAPALYLFYDHNGNYYEVYSSVTISKTQNTGYTGYICVIQEVLTRLYNKNPSLYSNFNPQGIDGTFGNNTRLAVVCFQVSRIGANAGDGVVGSTTWYYIFNDWYETLNRPWLTHI